MIFKRRQKRDGPAVPKARQPEPAECTDMMGIPVGSHSPNRKGVCTTCGQDVS